jgi:hypothetical protein
MRLAEVVAHRLQDGDHRSLHGVSFPEIDAVVREALVVLANCAPEALEACEVDVAEVEECGGPRCHQLIDPAHPGSAKDTADGWICGACLVDGGP